MLPSLKQSPSFRTENTAPAVETGLSSAVKRMGLSGGPEGQIVNGKVADRRSMPAIAKTCSSIVSAPDNGCERARTPGYSRFCGTGLKSETVERRTCLQLVSLISIPRFTVSVEMVNEVLIKYEGCHRSAASLQQSAM